MPQHLHPGRQVTRHGELIDACKKYLTVQAGIVSFACGKLEPELARDVNDRGFDVGLHVVFASRAGTTPTRTNALHNRFVAENKANWTQVRVFDTLVEAVPAKG